jgi:beta-aspartyl-peptidase (threonine type)
MRKLPIFHAGNAWRARIVNNDGAYRIDKNGHQTWLGWPALSGRAGPGDVRTITRRIRGYAFCACDQNKAALALAGLCIRLFPFQVQLESGLMRQQHGTKAMVAIHGGAGVISPSEMSPQLERDYRAGLAEALEAGNRVLAAGGLSIDAVVAAVCVMEDTPLFNAGRGAAFTAEGRNELDAAVMDGATLRAGAVTLVTCVKNPVKLAKVVMERTPHVMLAGAGAEAVARAHELEIVDPAYFFTQRRWDALQRMKGAKSSERQEAVAESDKHGTVGAVALDCGGNLAAATSTGGRTHKLAGRVGDSPIIGAGTYANNATVAVSATGEGEYFIRAVAAHTLSALMEFRNWSVGQAAEHVIGERLQALGGSGGLIALDRNGNISMPFSTAGMYRGCMTVGGAPEISIFRDR